MELELHRLDLRYERLRIAHPAGRFVASLAEHGQQQPVAAIEAPEGRFVLIDGFRRVASLRRLGNDTVEVLVLPLSEADALMWRYRMQTAGRRSALEEAWLLRELVSSHALTQGELARRLGRSESWVSRRLDLVRVLPERVQELVQKGRLCAHGAQKCLVPLARAKRADCERLAVGLAGHTVTSRQLERLYLAWKAGDAAQRQRIVEQPLLFFNALAEAEQPEPASPDDALCADLEAIAGMCHRARRRLGSRSARLSLPQPLSAAGRAAQAAIQSLTRTLEPLLDARSGHPDGGAPPAP
jgi:ParB family chromosome partitioning protein